MHKSILLGRGGVGLVGGNIKAQYGQTEIMLHGVK